jgi:hypothetical protein
MKSVTAWYDKVIWCLWSGRYTIIHNALARYSVIKISVHILQGHGEWKWIQYSSTNIMANWWLTIKSLDRNGDYYSLSKVQAIILLENGKRLFQT